MTLHDPEVLDALREEPELLAIADAVSETQPRPRASHRPVLSRLAALVAVGAAALLAVLLWPSGGGRNGILDRALAAIGDGPILHLVVRMPVGEQVVDIQTGRTTTPAYEVETWGDRDLEHFHMILRVDGRIVGELLYPEDRSSVMSLARIDPAYAALWSGFRKALADGSAKIEREGMLYGHDVYWLTFPGLGNSPGHNEVAIDSKTYEPLDFRSHAGSASLDQRVLLAQTEPFDSSDFTRRTARPNPFDGATSHGSGVQVSPVAPRAARPWLRAGDSVAGVKLAAVHQTRTTSGGRVTTGFELVYGSELSLRSSVLIDEAKRPDDSSEWEGIPKGSMRITEGGASEDNGQSYSLWTGRLVVNGVYVSIQTGLGRAALLEAARALRPA